MISSAAVDRFLECRHLAVIGASDNQNNFGRTVYEALRDHGHQVVAITNAGATVAGDKAYASLDEVPWPIDGAVVMVNRDAALSVIGTCAQHGVKQIWLFKGLGGPGASSEAAVALCAQLGLEVIDGACPLMFLEPAGVVHRLHRRVRQVRGQLIGAQP